MNQTLQNVYKHDNYTKFVDPKLTRQINFMLSLLHLSEDEELKSLLNNIETSSQASNIIIQYILKTQQIDFTSVWYKWIKRKINEFSYRYLKTNIINDTISNYKIIFKTFVMLSTETGIFNSEDVGNELGYFIASQFSNRFSLKEGMRVKVDSMLKMFSYDTACTIYERYKLLDYPATIQKPYDYFIHNIDSKLLKSINKLEDHKDSYFLDVAVPIIKGKIPNLKNKKYNWLYSYIYVLEYLIIRERKLNRKLNRVLLSIEHLRAHNRLLNVTK